MKIQKTNSPSIREIKAEVDNYIKSGNRSIEQIQIFTTGLMIDKIEKLEKALQRLTR